jgi:hypothetical protein
MKALTAEELTALWSDLDGEDAVRAWRAIWSLGAAPKEALPFLRERLKAPDPSRLAALLADLEDDDIEVREKALGELAHPAWEKALRDAPRGGPSVEARERIKEALRRIGMGKSRAARAWSRATQALELMGARELLESLGTSDARAAAARLARARP